VANSLKNGVVTGGVTFSASNNDPLNPLTSQPPGLTMSLQFADALNGGGSGVFALCDKVHVSQRTLVASAFEDLDLSTGGGLLDTLGAAFGVTKLKVILIELLTTTAAAGLTIGGAAANPITDLFGSATDKIKLRNGPGGGLFQITALDATGWAVAPAGARNLRIANADGALAATYNFAVGGKA
jgi:hypothetical protein